MQNYHVIARALPEASPLFQRGDCFAEDSLRYIHTENYWPIEIQLAKQNFLDYNLCCPGCVAQLVRAHVSHT